jgi:thioredoxin 1
MITATTKTLKTLLTENKEKLVLVDFWAPWCAPCLAIAPRVEKLALKYLGKGVVGAKFDIEANKLPGHKLKIESIPALLLFKNGKEVDRIVGLVPMKEIETLIKKHL